MGSVRGWGEFNVSNSKVNNGKLNQQYENKKEKKTDPVKIYVQYCKSYVHCTDSIIQDNKPKS